MCVYIYIFVCIYSSLFKSELYSKQYVNNSSLKNLFKSTYSEKRIIVFPIRKAFNFLRTFYFLFHQIILFEIDFLNLII